MIKACYYYTFKEIYDNPDFEKFNIENFLIGILNVTSLSGSFVPSDLTTNAAIYNELMSHVISRYRDHAIIKIVKCHNQEPTDAEVDAAFTQWGYKFLALLNDTHDYFMTILLAYNNAKTHLMDDITALSTNTVKYNDTPQNPNTSDIYEGDDYLTNFTKTHGTTSSPLMSKIMRLKEIQDNYKNMMFEWVKVFERIFFQEEI